MTTEKARRLPELQRGHGDDRKQRVPEPVPVVDGALGQPPRPGEAHVVGVEDVEQLAAAPAASRSASEYSARVMEGSRSERSPLVVSSPVVQGPRETTSPRPEEGSHCSWTAKRKMRSSPMRNVGTERPTSEPPRMTRESQDRRRMAV